MKTNKDDITYINYIIYLPYIHYRHYARKEVGMGRRNKAYFKDLHQQAYDRLTGMQAFGESKKEAVANGTEKDKIFAFNTYKSTGNIPNILSSTSRRSIRSVPR